MTNAGKVTNPLFGLGKPNDAFAQYFIGESFLNPLTDPEKTIFLANVTFEPGCRNNWHIHHADKGGGQILLCTDGRGWCQFWGEEARELHPGDVVFIPAGVWFLARPSYGLAPTREQLLGVCRLHLRGKDAVRRA